MSTMTIGDFKTFCGSKTNWTYFTEQLFESSYADDTEFIFQFHDGRKYQPDISCDDLTGLQMVGFVTFTDGEQNAVFCGYLEGNPAIIVELDCGDYCWIL